MLEGLERKWSPPRSEKQVIYPGLAPGNYTFKVIAVNENGIWNSEPIEFNFSIEPPFWRRWWFYLLCFIFITSIIIVYVRYRERQLIHQKNVLEQKVQERTI